MLLIKRRSGATGNAVSTRLAQSVDLVLSLHPQVFLVFLLEGLDSYRAFGLRAVLYNFLTDEFALSDEDTGTIIGVQSTMKTIVAFCGSIATDYFGVRRMAMISLALSLVGRGMLVVARTRSALYVSLLVITPIGEALLSAGLYRVALTKLTTARSRTIAFACGYAVLNFAGGIANIVIDRLKAASDVVILGRVYTGTRSFLASTWLAILAALLLVVFSLRDLSIVDADDDDDDASAARTSTSSVGIDSPPSSPALVI